MVSLCQPDVCASRLSVPGCTGLCQEDGANYFTDGRELCPALPQASLGVVPQANLIASYLAPLDPTSGLPRLDTWAA